MLNGLSSASKKAAKRSLRFRRFIRILVLVSNSTPHERLPTMSTKTLAVPAVSFTVLVRMCGRNRVRIAHALRTDDQGRVWATVAGCGRSRERLVLAITAA